MSDAKSRQHVTQPVPGFAPAQPRLHVHARSSARARPSIAIGARTRLPRPAFSPRAAAARPFRDGQQVRVARLGSRRALGVAVARLSRLHSARSCALAAAAAARAPPWLQANARGVCGRDRDQDAGAEGGGLLDPRMLWKSTPDAFRKLDPRLDDGQLLWPDRRGEKESNLMANSLGPYRRAGQMQQRPSAKEGDLLKRY